MRTVLNRLLGSGRGLGYEVSTLVSLVVLLLAAFSGWALIHVGDWEPKWEGFLAHELEPFTSSVVLPILGWLISLLVVGRLLVLVGAYEMRGMPLPRTKSRRQMEARVGGVAAVASAIPLAALVAVEPPEWRAWALATMTLGLGMLACFAFARWWAASRSIVVEARSGKDDDTAGAAQVMALLRDLGADAPRGIEMGQGPDVTALSESGLAAEPPNAVAAAVFRLVGVLIPRAVWRVQVEREDDDQMTVRVLRNGHLRITALLDRDALALRVKLPRESGAQRAEAKDKEAVYPDLHKMAAAVALTQMVGAYDDMEGLGGARDWRSVGLHAIATMDFTATDDQLTLLSKAIEWDAGNRYAWAAYWYLRGRESTDPHCINEYIEWLSDEIQEVDNEAKMVERGVGPAYRRRLKMNMAVAAINRVYLEDPTDELVSAYRNVARAACVALVKDLLEREPKLDENNGRIVCPPTQEPSGKSLAWEMWASAAPMYLTTIRWDPADSAKKMHQYESFARDQLKTAHSLGPVACYNRACYLATEEGSADYRTVVGLLGMSDSLPRLREWRQVDPQLAGFRESVAYKRAFLAPASQDLTTLKAFAQHESALRETGLQHVTRFLYVAERQPQRLAGRLSIDRLQVERLKEIAQLAESIRDHSVRHHLKCCAECYLDVCDAIVEQGVPLGPGSIGSAVDLPALTDTLRAKLKRPPGHAELTKLLGERKEQ